MTYIMSDIHGQYKAFVRILKKLKFDPATDKLIVIGDVVDRGGDGLDIIKYLRPLIDSGAAILIKGNHELFVQMYLEGELDRHTWISWGGYDTVEAVDRLNAEKKTELLEFIKGLPHLMELEAEPFGRVVVTHTGIHADYYEYNADGTINVAKSIEKAVQENEFEYLISRDIHDIPAGEIKRFNSFVFCGHVPTFKIFSGCAKRIFKSKYYIDFDCGAGHRDEGGVLGCFCLETGEEMYK